MPVKVGGYGPDTYDYYYTATYMDEARKNCPASCDVCSDVCRESNELPSSSHMQTCMYM